MILARGPHVYVATEGSSAMEAGDHVTFRMRKRELASGIVVRVLDVEIAKIQLVTGSLAGVRKLERLQLFAERSPIEKSARLRIGYPGAARSNLLFSCERIEVVPRLALGAYRVHASTLRETRWTRDAAVPLPAPWPDTLIARFFDESDDEEIALERGELDVAVFWPGELSRHLREQSRWQGHLWGTRAQGFVAALGLRGPGSDSASVTPDSSALERFNRELFRGDLVRWDGSAKRSIPSGPIRFEVDLASPGWREMQRLLDTFAPPTTTRRARLEFVDRPVTSADSLEGTGVTPLFRVRCPVVCTPELRPYVTALGVDALVDAIDCRVRARRP